MQHRTVRALYGRNTKLRAIVSAECIAFKTAICSHIVDLTLISSCLSSFLQSVFNSFLSFVFISRHELSSPSPTLRSWVRIPLRHGCLCVFCVLFFCFYIVSSETASRPDKRLMRTYHWISLFMSYIKSAN
jgi:hypothetical protein